MSSFNTYTTPAPNLLFSRQWFEVATIEAIARSADAYPQFAPAKSLRKWEWLDDEPASAKATLIAPNEVIPHLGDLLEITGGMQAAFDAGKRSVMVHFTTDQSEHQYIYHFSKV
ncbi:hypothetical protein BKA70DRAFT_1069197, partial [Coprinopsis sp. MPI-PUGE-AT-0042]